MSDITTVDITTVVDKHLAGYCEPDPTRRTKAVCDPRHRSSRHS